jgi:hypothetical protein
MDYDWDLGIVEHIPGSVSTQRAAGCCNVYFQKLGMNVNTQIATIYDNT